MTGYEFQVVRSAVESLTMSTDARVAVGAVECRLTRRFTRKARQRVEFLPLYEPKLPPGAVWWRNGRHGILLGAHSLPDDFPANDGIYAGEWRDLIVPTRLVAPLAAAAQGIFGGEPRIVASYGPLATAWVRFPVTSGWWVPDDPAKDPWPVPELAWPVWVDGQDRVQGHLAVAVSGPLNDSLYHRVDSGPVAVLNHMVAAEQHAAAVAAPSLRPFGAYKGEWLWAVQTDGTAATITSPDHPGEDISLYPEEMWILRHPIPDRGRAD